MPEENSENTNIENGNKSKEEKGPCTGETCTIEMCRRCHANSHKCAVSKVDGEMDENN